MAKTVKVRVFVLVNEDGDWGAHGWSSATDEQELRDCAAECLSDEKQERGYWLTAELPIPERDKREPEVAAEVSDG